MNRYVLTSGLIVFESISFDFETALLMIPWNKIHKLLNCFPIFIVTGWKIFSVFVLFRGFLLLLLFESHLWLGLDSNRTLVKVRERSWFLLNVIKHTVSDVTVNSILYGTRPQSLPNLNQML